MGITKHVHILLLNIDQHKQAFAEHIKKLEDNQEARVLGGDQLPKNSTTLFFNCNS